MRPILVVLAFIALSLAGCSDGSSPPADDDDPFDDLPQDPVSADKGLIRGIVIDPSIVPVEGATVTLLGANKEATSNADGAFVFNDLDPGTYFLEVSKVGFSKVQASTTVVAGVAKPDIVKVQIDRLPGTEPRVETYEDVGFIVCGWGVPVTYGYCGEELGTPDDFRLQYEITGTPRWIQVEIVWESGNPSSTNLYMINSFCPPENKDSCPGAIAAGRRWDEGTYQSPAVMRTPEGFVEQAMDQFGAEDTEGWWVGIDVSADGPALATGVTIDQEFRGYTTVFWNMDPIEDWIFFEDGPHPVPS